MYCCAHKTATLTPIQHTVPLPLPFRTIGWMYWKWAQISPPVSTGPDCEFELLKSFPSSLQTNSGGKFNLFCFSGARGLLYILKQQSYFYQKKIWLPIFGDFCNILAIFMSKYLDKQKSMPRLHEFCLCSASRLAADAELKEEKKITFYCFSRFSQLEKKVRHTF